MTGVSILKSGSPELAASSSRAVSEYAIQAVHEAPYLEFLRFAPLEKPGAEIKARWHPGEEMMRLPGHVEARAGFYLADGITALSKETWTAACDDARAVVEGARLLLAGREQVVVRCRKPGRHAHAGRAARGCYLNYAAIASSYLRETLTRVAVLSLGEHHANGTQSIFLPREDVFCVSVHGDPAERYPFYNGYADELGIDEGAGGNLNLVLASDANERAVETALAQARAAIMRFAPDAVVVDIEAGLAAPYDCLSRSGPANAARRLSTELERPVLVISM